MDSSFLHKVTLVVTFCRNELFYSAMGHLFSMKYTNFWRKIFYTTEKTASVNTNQ